MGLSLCFPYPHPLPLQDSPPFLLFTFSKECKDSINKPLNTFEFKKKIMDNVNINTGFNFPNQFTSIGRKPEKEFLSF